MAVRIYVEVGIDFEEMMEKYIEKKFQDQVVDSIEYEQTKLFVVQLDDCNANRSISYWLAETMPLNSYKLIFQYDGGDIYKYGKLRPSHLSLTVRITDLEEDPDVPADRREDRT